MRWLLRRVAEIAVTLWGVTVVVFGASWLTGDPAEVLVSVEGRTEEQVEQIRTDLGLDLPLWEQYGRFVGGLVTGDFGRSFVTGQPVWAILEHRITPSLSLAATAMVMAVLMSLPLGIAAGVWRGSWVDRLARTVALAGQAVPSFWLGLVVILVFAVWLRWLPTGGRTGWTSVILPAFTLSWLISAGIVRLLRASMIEAMESDYVRFARSFGMSPVRVVWEWALRNALVPVVTFIGFMLSIIIAGAVVIEVVFSWPGLGRLAYEATLSRDFPVLRGAVVVWALLVVAVSFATDVLTGLIDPRIRK